MKYAIFDNLGFPKAFYDDEIHETIPKEAIQIMEEQWLEFINNQGQMVWDFDTNTVKAYTPPPPTLDELKAQKLNELQTTTKNYIEQFYPQIKQMSDASDKNNGESYLLLQNIDTIQLRKDITNETIKNYPDFTTALNNILIKYQSSTNQLINYWLTQGLKIAFRNYFVFLVKQEYYNLETQINNATSEAELPAITFTTIFPEGL